MPASRQLRLFATENPLEARFGREFFRGLPAGPGVYFFFGEGDRLLYIGRSVSLRRRVGSYRHLDAARHARRTLRLAGLVRRIEWRECGSASEAVALERALLLERRPPFNRAGVWPGQPWWVEARGGLELVLRREAADFGPFRSSFRPLFHSLARCLFRLERPDRTLAEYPMGVLGGRGPREVGLRLGERDAAAVRRWLGGEPGDLLARLGALPPVAGSAEREFWAAEQERLAELLPRVDDAGLPEIPV